MNDGGTAFPHSRSGMFGENKVTDGGMSLRDWFAGQFLAGLNPDGVRSVGGEDPFKTAAQIAYKQDDAMLAERAKGTS